MITLQILIVYGSESGNTKKVVDLLNQEMTQLGYNVRVKHALTANTDDIALADLLLVGTPVHGYMLFGHKPIESVQKFLNSRLPENLEDKPVLGFSTYLFFPAGTMRYIEKSIKNRNGRIIGSFSQRRNKKQQLVSEIIHCLTTRRTD